MSWVTDAIDERENFRLHPLGFFFLAKEQPEGTNRRVHIWSEELFSEKQISNDLHMHSFDIYSTIFVGCMKSELFKFREVPDGGEQEFSVKYEGERSTLLPTSRKGILENISSFESRTGCSYFLSAGTIHRVSISNRPCISLLVTQERNFPILCYGKDDEKPFERRLVNSAESKDILRLLKSIVV